MRSQRIERSAGDAPSLGRVARMPAVGTGGRRRRSKSSDAAGRGKRRRGNVLTWWFGVLVLCVVVFLGVVLGLWLRSAKDQGSAEERKAAAQPVVEERVVSRFASPSQEEALLLVRRALAIQGVSQVAEYFHLGSSSPEVVLVFLRDLERTDGVVEGVDWLGSMDRNGLLIDGVAVNSRLGNKTRTRLALLTPDERGKWKIDFDAFARTVSPPWKELLGNESGQGVVRVMVARDHYFNGRFRDEAEWECYGMVSPDTRSVMMGYCRKGSAQAAALARIVAENEGAGGGQPVRRATLEIRHSPGTEARQFEIVRVLAEDWVLSATPFDSSFR